MTPVEAIEGRGRFVVNTRSGRIGLLGSTYVASRRAVVKFVADGPTEAMGTFNLRFATRAEVVEAGLLGVSHVQKYANKMRVIPSPLPKETPDVP